MTKLIPEQDKLRHFLRRARVILGLVLLVLQVLKQILELF